MIKDFQKTAIVTAEREISYAELIQRIAHFALQLPDLSCSEADADESAAIAATKIGKCLIFSENREGWVYALFAVWQKEGIVVPVDATSTVPDVAYIIKDCTPTHAWVSTQCLDTFKAAMAEAGINVTIHIIDEYEKQLMPADIASYVADETLSPFSDKASDAVRERPGLIVYTSGTTGSPKGVVLSYRNMIANVRGVSKEVHIFDDKRRTLVLLPLHHVLPLMGSVIAPITLGGGIAICPSMTAADIMSTLCRGKVAIIIGVPRLWQMLFGGIKKKIDASFVTRTLYNICKKANNPSLSKFVFQSIRKKMGGHLDFCVSGGAALDKEIGEGLRTIGLDVLEGYGMTETAPIIAFTRPGDIIPGCVGKPLPSMHCKLVNTVRHEEFGGAEVGELCAKGPNVMSGYYNRPEETAAVIDKGGYIHTGDLARFDRRGRIIITGRSKEIIVLSNGKNVQPNEIEFKLETYDKQVKEAAVTQDGDMLRAIIVPQEEWAEGKTDAEQEQLLKKEVVEPYNRTVENYKKIMSIFVYHNDLPRTKLDKLQRFKLQAILNNEMPAEKPADDTPVNEPDTEEYRIIKKYIEDEKKIAVRPDSHIETDLAFDSLEKVGLQSFIEQNFGVTLNADTMAEFKDVEAIAEFVAEGKTHIDSERTDWRTLLCEETQSSKLKLPIASWTHPLFSKIFTLSFKLHNRLTITGAENIPENGPYILAPNHQSFIDGPLALVGMPWSKISDCYFYATEEHVKGPVLKHLASRHNIILMERHNLKNSILKMAEVLKQGKNIMIFPEGTRTRSGHVATFKRTFAILSTELDVPIVPVCIRGAYEAMPRGRMLPTPHHISVEYLPAIYPAETDSYDTLAERVRNAINDKI